MNYGIIQNPSLTNTECLVLGIFSDKELPAWVQALDKSHQGILSKLAKKATEAGDALWQNDIDGHRVLVIQCGNSLQFTSIQLKKRVTELTDALIKHRIHSATVCLPEVQEHDANWQLEQMILLMDNQCYQLLDFKSKNKKTHQLSSIEFYLPNAQDQALQRAKAITSGVAFARTLANLPANTCTPSYLGEQALQLANEFKTIECSVFGPNEIRDMGMGAFLAVAQGSDQEPRFIDIQYKGASTAAPIVLVGKGITFDSGGLSIKPANAMDEMKYDMCGAASVLGTIKACALLQLPIHVIGLIASTENMLNGSAVKCGDIVTSMSGQTIEIINTDAEGRLVLADALTYAERYHPQCVIDVATLTGAMVVALGSVASGYMTQDEQLAGLIEHAAKQSEDRVWRMPLDEAYQDAIDSPLADMINAAFDRTGGAITAACFLSRFTESYPWAHIDIAGTAWISGKKRNATGRPVPLLTQLVSHVAHTR